MLNLKIIFLLLFYSNLFSSVIKINEHSSFFDLLQNSEIYLDKNRDLTINKIQNQDIKFEKNDKNILSFGYSPSFDVWIKFTLKNDSNKIVKKIIEYNNPLTTNLAFFDLKDELNTQEDGLLSKKN